MKLIYYYELHTVDKFYILKWYTLFLHFVIKILIEAAYAASKDSDNPIFKMKSFIFKNILLLLKLLKIIIFFNYFFIIFNYFFYC